MAGKVNLAKSVAINKKLEFMKENNVMKRKKKNEIEKEMQKEN